MNSSFRVVGLGIVVLSVLVPVARADTRPSSIVNVLEVRRLTSRSDSDAHVRLAAHFTALARQHDVDAKRHDDMAVVANASRATSSQMLVHCRALAAERRDSASLLRRLATHHDALRTGVASALPTDAAQFASGAGAPPPTPGELRILVASAHTPAEHNDLGEYFRGLERRYMTEAADFRRMASSYSGGRLSTSLAGWDGHARRSREAARVAAAAALEHENMSSQAVR